MQDSFFENVEKKTKVSKNTLFSLANKLQSGNMKDEKTLNEIIDTLSKATGKEVTSERRDKIISTIMSDNVPEGIEKMF